MPFLSSGRYRDELQAMQTDGRMQDDIDHADWLSSSLDDIRSLTSPSAIGSTLSSPVQTWAATPDVYAVPTPTPIPRIARPQLPDTDLSVPTPRPSPSPADDLG